MTPTDIDELEIRLLLQAIQARYGYDFREYAPDSMRRRLQSAQVRLGVAHLGELQHRVLRDPVFFRRLLEDLTVRVSDMFRDPSVYRAFRQGVLPMLRSYPQLKIWHAGCASGEEVYATAIMLQEEGLYERTQLYATDVSSLALEQAKEGIYDLARVAGFSQNYLEAGGTGHFEDYCSIAYGTVALRSELQRNMVFFQHNLVTDHSLGEMNVVFCRNVLIYFDANLRERVVRMFEDCLAPRGFLCLGSSECLPGSVRPAFRELAPSSRIYRQQGTA